MMKVSHLIACPMVFNLLCHLSRQTDMFKTYKKSSLLSIFRRLFPFLQVFGQIKGCLIIKLHKIIRLSHVAACPIAFLCFTSEVSEERYVQSYEK